MAAEGFQSSEATLRDGEDLPIWWTTERSRLDRWLDRNMPVLAPVYRGAVRMAFDEDFPGRVHFVSHAVREMRNRLPGAFADVPKRIDYHSLADAVHAAWIREDLPTANPSLTESREASVEGPVTYNVSESLVTAVGELVTRHQDAKGNKALKARLLLEAVGEAQVPEYVVEHWIQATDWVHKHMHVSADAKPLDRDETELLQNFETFESALSAIVNRSYENMDALDELLDAANR